MGTWQKLGIFSLLDEQKTDSLQSGKCQTWLLKLFTFFVSNFVNPWDKNSTIKIMLFLLSIQLITLGFAAVSYFWGSFFPWQIGSLTYKWGSQIVLCKARKIDSIKTRKHVQNMNGNLVLSFLCRLNVFISYFEAIFSHGNTYSPDA